MSDTGRTTGNCATCGRTTTHPVYIDGRDHCGERDCAERELAYWREVDAMHRNYQPLPDGGAA